MSVFRITKNSNYTVMSNYHLREKEMSLKAKGLLSVILSLPEDWDYSIIGLATLSNDGETAVRSALKELEKFGYLSRIPIRESGKIVDWEYNVFENPVVKKPDVENQHVENQSQINTNKQNTKKINTNNSKELLQNFQFGKKSSKKSSLYDKCVALVDDFISKNNCNELMIRKKLLEYLNFRLQVRDKPLYVNVWKGILNKLDILHKEGFGYETIINFAIERGYLSFYPPSDNRIKNRVSEVGVNSNRISDEDRILAHKQALERESRGERGIF